MTQWLAQLRADLPPAQALVRVANIFVVFDARTQDSGNVSFGVEALGRRWFVKTAGDPAGPRPALDHGARIALLRNAERLAGCVRHAALPPLRAVKPSAWGPMLIYDWAPGELARAPPQRRHDPHSAGQRLRRLPPAQIEAVIDTLLDAHLALGLAGWIAGDLYDGCLIYDFGRAKLWLIDLDHYHHGPFVNGMGRLFGSTRFMAPEEFERGAWIDARTTVFTLGRFAAELLGDGTLERSAFRGTEGQFAAMRLACQLDPDARPPDVAALAALWRG